MKRIRHCILCFMCLWITSTPIQASGKGMITLYIQNDKQEAMRDVRVYIKTARGKQVQKSTTNNDGTIIIDELSVGDYIIDVEEPESYQTVRMQELHINASNEEQMIHMTITLRKAHIINQQHHYEIVYLFIACLQLALYALLYIHKKSSFLQLFDDFVL